MTGKTRRTNCPTLSAEGIAARLRGDDAPRLCLLPSAAAAAQVKRGFSGIRQLPLLLPVGQLLAAAARLPVDANLPQMAAVLPAADGGKPLPWKMLAAMQDACGVGNREARLDLAKKLAALFAEVDAHLPLAAGENPFADLHTHEGGAAKAMWDVFREDALEIQPLLRELAAVLPPFLAVCDESTTPVQCAFYAECAAEVVEILPPEGDAMWRDAFALDGAMPAECAHAASEGAGETLTETAEIALCALRELLVAQADAEEGIGVVVYDRLLARRLRAVAEAAGILIADRSGWRAETLSYGAALAHSAKVLLDEFSLAAVQQVLQTPFYARAETAAALPDAAAAWRQWFAEALDLPADADALAAACAQRAAQKARDGYKEESRQCKELLPLLRALADSRAAAAEKVQPPAQWLEWLMAAAADLCAAWEGDRVAQQLRAQLARRAAGGMGGVELPAAEFLLWLRDALADERVSEDEIQSPVEFVEPGRRRIFAAVLLLGCSGSLLAEAQGYLGERERSALGLPSPAQRAARERADFAHLLANHTRVAAVWRGVDEQGAPQPAHPFWEVFADHCRAHNRLRKIKSPPVRQVADDVPPPAKGAKWEKVQLPARLRTSTAETAMACPYRFYALHGLRLQDEEAPDVDNISAMMSGSLMHKALAAFSGKSAEMTEAAEMLACWRETAAETLRGNRPGLGLLRQYWHENGGALVEWEMQRRAQGWRTVGRECKVEDKLDLPGGAQVTLSGRIDRLDENASGMLAVVDYKTGTKPRRDLLTYGELPQLPLYAFLVEMQEGAAVDEQLLCRPLHHRGDNWQLSGDASPRRVAARLRHALRKAADGAPLPANGALTGACAGCAAEGLCRREHWQQA